MSFDGTKFDSNVDSNLIGSKSFGEIEDWVDPEDVDNDVLDLLLHFS